MTVRGLGSAMPWGRQGRVRYYGQVVEHRDEEEGRIVGLMRSCMCCCLKTVLCRRGVVPAG